MADSNPPNVGDEDEDAHYHLPSDLLDDTALSPTTTHTQPQPQHDGPPPTQAFPSSVSPLNSQDPPIVSPPVIDHPTQPQSQATGLLAPAQHLPQLFQG